VAAAARRRIPPALIDQLAPGGRIVAPVEERGEQRLALLREHGGELRIARLDRVRFVPLHSRRF
jgi:protein-L-isoaspartate(D-aspartate) O-methyltransferase